MIKVGEKFKEKRLEKGLSFEDVSKNTKIKISFLEAIENGEYEKLPSVSYAQGFVRNYAKFLGLNEKETMAIFRREFDEERTFKVLPRGFEQKDNFPTSGFKIKQTAFIVLIVIAGFILYILFQYRYAFLNPPLNVITPKDMQQISSSVVNVSGQTDPNATVYVNNNAVSVDDNGNFQKFVDVFPGKTFITVKVVNKFSRQSEKTLEVFIKPGQ